MNIDLINRVVEADGEEVKHGKYVYKFNKEKSEVLRCKLNNKDRLWISPEGVQFDAWEHVMKIAEK